MTPPQEPGPIACSLDTGSLAERVPEWQAEREKRSCAFFDVAIDLGPDSRTHSLACRPVARTRWPPSWRSSTPESAQVVKGAGPQRVDAEVGDRPGHHRGIDTAAESQLLQDGDDEVGGVDLEVRAEGRPGVGAAEPVGPERGVGAVHEARHLVGHAAHVVGDGDDGIGARAEGPGHQGPAPLAVGVEPVPTFRLDRASTRRLVHEVTAQASAPTP